MQADQLHSFISLNADGTATHYLSLRGITAIRIDCITYELRFAWIDFGTKIYPAKIL